MAFANTAGGTLLLGVEDRSRHVRGVRDPLDLEERLANLISDLVTPRLVPEPETLPWRRTQVLAVQVYLRKHGYPPDKQEKATQTVLEQAEVLSQAWAAA